MNRILHRAAIFASLALCSSLYAVNALAGNREEARVLTATQVLEEMQNMPDQRVPDWLLERAYGIAVIPDLWKAGFVAGAKHGQGLLVVRDASGRWSNPAFVSLNGGSFGWQAGVQQADIILVFTTKASVDGINGGKMTLGADASVAAGPVGRSATGSTDFNFKAEIYSYSRSKGLFAGLAIDGSALTIDHKSNASYYQKKNVTVDEIFAASAPLPPESGQRFLAALAHVATTKSPVRDASAPQAVGPEQTPAATDVKTYPMEEAKSAQGPHGN
jgi:lipid-binding SYLF domain-containing protein